MIKLKTHFEQVPLEIVRKIVDEESQRLIAAELARGAKKKALELDRPETATVSG